MLDHANALGLSLCRHERCAGTSLAPGRGIQGLSWLVCPCYMKGQIVGDFGDHSAGCFGVSVWLRRFEISVGPTSRPIGSEFSLRLFATSYSAFRFRNTPIMFGGVRSSPLRSAGRYRIRMARPSTVLGGTLFDGFCARSVAVATPFPSWREVEPIRYESPPLLNQDRFYRANILPRSCRAYRFNGEPFGAILLKSFIEHICARFPPRVRQVLNPAASQFTASDADVLFSAGDTGNDVGLKHIAMCLASSKGILAIKAEAAFLAEELLGAM